MVKYVLHELSRMRNNGYVPEVNTGISCTHHIHCTYKKIEVYSVERRRQSHEKGIDVQIPALLVVIMKYFYAGEQYAMMAH